MVHVFFFMDLEDVCYFFQPNNNSYSNNYHDETHQIDDFNDDVCKIPDNSFGDSDKESDGEATDVSQLCDPNYIPPDKVYIDVLKEYFGHAKFRP